MAPVISLLIILSFSLLITRVATVALTLTGLSQEAARFQARSAFTGVGFTTSESEQVVAHPVRRRILMVLMMSGNAGIVTVMATLILSFMGSANQTEAMLRALEILAGMLVILWVARSQWVTRHLNVVILWALARWTDLDLKDYAHLFQLSGGYAVSEMLVKPADWMADRTLADLGLAGEGVLVLGIHRRGGEYIGAPTGATRINASDRLILYGKREQIKELDCRSCGKEGALAHEQAVERQQKVLTAQEEAVSP